jgi:hypothetical protein
VLTILANTKWMLVTVSALFVTFLLFLSFGLEFSMLRSDPLTYWNNSLSIRQALFSTWFPPLYPLMIAAVRLVSLGAIPPLTIMVSITFVAYLVACFQTQRLAEEAGWSKSLVFPITLLFAAYPLVGLTYSVYPIADILAVAFIALAIRTFREHRWAKLAVWGAAAMVTHKATWFFVPALMLVSFFVNPSSRKWMALGFLPLIAIEIAGWCYHEDALWMIRWSKEYLLTSRSHIPIFDGIFGTFQLPGFASKAKAIIIILILFWAIALVLTSLRQRMWWTLVLSLCFVGMVAIVNQYEIWSVVRFSRLLFLLSLIAFAGISDRFEPFLKGPRFLLIFILAIGTNILYGYYMAKVYFSVNEVLAKLSNNVPN